jgi:1,6-anhydro-N-acetylmuramate kinase
VRAASIPLVCEVRREGLVTTLIADFIFACDPCAKRTSTALWRGRQAGTTEHTKSEKDESPRVIEETRQCIRDFEHVAEMIDGGRVARQDAVGAHGQTVIHHIRVNASLEMQKVKADSNGKNI